eukprot:1860311-Pyramimonas_sp.AAC.1
MQAPDGEFKPLVVNSHLPSGEFKPLVVNSHLPTDEFKPLVVNSHRPTGEFTCFSGVFTHLWLAVLHAPEAVHEAHGGLLPYLRLVASGGRLVEADDHIVPVDGVAVFGLGQ